MKKTGNCLICDELIIDPKCSLCLKRDIINWLRDKDLPEEKKSELNKAVSIILSYAMLIPKGSARCVSCYRLISSICNYCLVEYSSAIAHSSKSKQKIRVS